MMVSQADASLRLEGLERIYVERVAAPGDELSASWLSQAIGSLIPVDLAEPELAARACRLQDTEVADEWPRPWSDLETAARCLTDGSAAVVKYRDFKTAASIERR